MTDRFAQLQCFFQKHKKVALAFSGGVDSAFLLRFAQKIGVDIKAYFVHSEFQPSFEERDVLRFSKLCQADVQILNISVFDDEEIVRGGKDRCYHCKRKMFSYITDLAKKDGYQVVIDGTNASDDVAGRPGYVALQEYGILSPLKMCGVTKDDVRAASKELGLFTWDKPSYSCLATRIVSGRIDEQSLIDIEQGEKILFEYGFSNFRLRKDGATAILQLSVRDKREYLDKKAEIFDRLESIFDKVIEGEWRK